MANVTTNDVKNYLDTQYVATDPKHPGRYFKTLSDLSNNPQITSNLMAYDFDAIKNAIYPTARSCDALYLNQHLNFIEFKTGLKTVYGSELEKEKIENMKLSIQLKACHTMQLFNGDIMPYIDDGELVDGVEKIFCAVIDSNDQNLAEDTYTDALLDACGISTNVSLKKSMLDGIMNVIKKSTKKKNKFLYDRAFVLYDYEFDKKVSEFK